ncbi:MAG: antitoxin [Chlorobium sp.]
MTLALTDITTTQGKQAITLPVAMQINDNRVYLKKVGNAIYLIPYHNPWHNLIDGAKSFTPDFSIKRDNQQQLPRETFE